MSGASRQENGLGVKTKDEIWNPKQNNENHLKCASPDFTAGHQDHKTPSPRDALLGKENAGGLQDTRAIIVEDAKGGVNRSSNNGRCSSKCYAWLSDKRYIVLILGMIMFFIGCSLLAVSIYVMHTTEHCDKQIIINNDNTTKVTLALPVIRNTSLSTDSYHENVTAGSRTTPPTRSTVPSTTEEILKNNIALGRPAYQSSTFVEQAFSYRASLATDGHAEYLFSKGFCARTNRERRPFWYVDLGRFELVQTVRIFTPRDIPTGELRNFEVRIGQGKDLDLNPLCHHYTGTAHVYTLTIRCHRPMYGRYVSIVLLGDETYPVNRLTLCEVQVYNR